MKAVIHREPNVGWMIKSAAIAQESDGNDYISVLFELEMVMVCVPKSSNKAIGLDYKSNGLYRDSNGNIGNNHKYYREGQEKLAKAQHKLKDKTKGSNNYKKSREGLPKSINILRTNALTICTSFLMG